MADRTVKVSLVAQVNGYVSGMEQAARKTRELGSESEKLAQKREAFDVLGRSFLTVGALAAAGVGLAVKRFADFDQAMSNVKAATQETTDNMDLLRDAALDAGATTVFTATEAANAIEELGKAGLSTQEILDGGLKGALSLASAGQLDVAEAAKIAAIAVKQFGLEGAQVPHVADLLAAGAGKAVGSVQDLSAALGQSGLVANQTGLSIEETTGVLAAFADKGLLGSDAGTSLKTALQSLTPSSKAAAAEMDRLNIKAFDGAGEFIGIAKFAGVYQSALKKLNPEQQATTSKIIFGSDAVRAANVFYDLGADGIQRYVDQTNDAGYAAKVAADRLDNLAGDVEKLGGSFDTALIKTGSGANDVLRETVQTVTFLVDSVGNLPAPALNAGLAVGVVAAAIGLTGGAALVAVPRIAAAKAALVALNTTSKAAAIGVGLAGGAVGVAVIALGVLAGAQAETAGTTAELTDSLNQSSGALTDYSRAIVAKKLAESGAFTAAGKAGITQRELTDAVLEGAGATDVLRQKMQDYRSELGFDPIGVFQYDSAITSIATLSGSVEDSRTQFLDQKASMTEAAKAAEEAGGSFGGMGGSVADASSELSDFTAQLRDFGSEALNVEEAQADLEAAIDSASESIKTNGKSLDIGTEKGRANRDALRGIVEAAQESAAAILENGGSADEAAAALDRGRDAVEKLRKKLGVGKDSVEDYNKALNLTPDQIKTEMKLQGVSAAKATLENFFRSFNGRTISIKVNADGGYNAPKGSGGNNARAMGGAIYGPGGPTDDDAGLYALSNGEHVLTSSDVTAMGGQKSVYAFRESLYSPSPAMSGGGGSSTVVNQFDVSVVLRALAVDNPELLTRTVTQGIQTALRDGTIKTNWNTAS